MSKNRKRQRFNKKIREIIEHADLDVEFYPKEMSTVEIEEFYLKIKNRVGTIDIGTKNNYGFSDYTPYNALTGSEIISKSTITDPQMKMPGGYNSTKK